MLQGNVEMGSATNFHSVHEKVTHRCSLVNNLVILEPISLLFNHKLECPPSKVPVCEVVNQPFKTLDVQLII